MSMLKQLRKRIPDLDGDDVLDYLGLESRRSTPQRVGSTLAIFGAGVVLGVGLGLLLAPKSGSALRDDLSRRLSGDDDDDAEQSPSPSVERTVRPVS
jgi:hypothetical protein